MHVTSSIPHHAKERESILRRAILSLLKLLAEGFAAEHIVLRWLLDTRRLLVSHPGDKYSAWLTTIGRTIKDKGCAKRPLDTLEGQLNHAAYT